MNVESLKDIKASRLGAIFILFIATISTGLLTLFLFLPVLLKSFNLVIVILLSISLSAPVNIVTGMIMSSINKGGSSQEHEENITELMLNSSMLTIIIFYISLLSAYLFDLDFRDFLKCIIGSIFILSLIEFILEKKS